MISIITAIGICVIVCAAAVTFAYSQRQSPTVPNGMAAFSALRSHILEYTRQIEEARESDDEEYDDAILLAQKSTCYQILYIVNRIASEAYGVDADVVCADATSGMSVKELIYALGTFPLDDKVRCYTDSGTHKVTICFEQKGTDTVMLFDDAMVAE